jgi:hypothetical protein
MANSSLSVSHPQSHGDLGSAPVGACQGEGLTGKESGESRGGAPLRQAAAPGRDTVSRVRRGSEGARA